jgi:hypothetical protein
MMSIKKQIYIKYIMKIAFLFLLIDNPHFPELWDEYFKNNEDKYNLYIHPKYPDKHTWRPNNVIHNIQETAWGFITKAYIELFKEAYKNKENVKFITISESGVPIKSFDIFYNNCLNKENIDKSWIKLMKIRKYDYEARLLAHINSIKESHKKMFIPNSKNIIKHYARFCLRRKDVKKLLIANEEGKMEFFNTMHVGDEFFLSVITPLNKENYVDYSVTFDDWDYVKNEVKKINELIKQAYDSIENDKITSKEKNKYLIQIEELTSLKQSIGKNPKTIVDVTEDLENIKNVDSYFYRKFSKTSNISEYWQSIINKN